jgi:hypothetical protein
MKCMGFLGGTAGLPNFWEKAEGEKGKRLLDFNKYVKCASTRPVTPIRSIPSLSILEEPTFGPVGHHGNHRKETKGK